MTNPNWNNLINRAGLTPRQREVLALLIHGMSNKEIARALDIAEATTKIHLSGLRRALGRSPVQQGEIAP
jgi:DNA-binding CsgD family transcriptional regulator